MNETAQDMEVKMTMQGQGVVSLTALDAPSIVFSSSVAMEMKNLLGTTAGNPSVDDCYNVHNP